MLEKATNQEIDALVHAEGKIVHWVNLTEIPRGSLVQICTESGNTYILETTSHGRTHIVRFSPNERSRTKGYLGEQDIEPSIIKVGEVLVHNNYKTQPIVAISLLSS